ncbi:MAG: T9SS type B sorting domain-containing protein [Gammaproteobacteria bacterium]|nr:T9SS type B sorting domain-containing protein [Gammaproteobacteria bacterium]
MATTCDEQQVDTSSETFEASNGCDSIVTTITELLPSYEVTVMATTCDEQQVDTSSETFEASNGCDSIVTTITELLPSYEVTIIATTCDEQQVDTSSETFEASNGCDSIVTTITELLPSYEVFLQDQTCSPDEAGTFIENLRASNGCDSTVTTIIALLPGPDLPDSATVECNDTINNTGDWCMPLAFNDFVTGYDLYIDGELNFDLPFICDLDTSGGYDFTTVIENQTYGGSEHILRSWVVDGVELVVEDYTYNTFEELAAYMQSVNPQGGWAVEDGDRIEGGLQNSQADYGTIQVFSPEIGAAAFVNYNLGIISLGTLVEDIPNGCHWITVVDVQTGCTDSTYVCVDCFTPPVTDTIIVNIPEDSTEIVCVDQYYDLDTLVDAGICDNGGLVLNPVSDFCVDITNDVDGYENDTICVFHCDGNICDTTIIIIVTDPPVPVTDTIIVEIPEDSTDIVCVDDVYDLNGLTGSGICDAGDLGVITDDGFCVTITNDVDGYENDTICVFHCDGNICDTTIIIVVPEPPVVVTDTVIVNIPEDSTDIVCVEEYYDLSGLTNAGLCDDGGLVLGGVADPFCIEITNDIDGYENDTICVFHCDGNICDTTIIIVVADPPVPVTDTIIVYIPEDSIDIVCVDEVYDLDDVDGASVCDAGDLGVVTSDDNLCVVITNDNDGYQPDTICVLHCDGNICDTTIIIVIPEPPVPVTDTIIVEIPQDSTDIVCVDEVFDLDEVDGASICDAGDLGVAIDDSSLCVDITNDNDGYENDTICVVHCEGDICDTTIIIVVTEPPVVNVDTIVVNIPEGGLDTVCVTDVYDLDNVNGASICDGGDGDIGIIVDPDDLCVVLGVSEDDYENDTICVFHCDGAICDTTIIIIVSDPPAPVTDTIIVEIPEDSTDIVCVTEVFDGNPDLAGGVSICDDSGLDVFLDDDGLCVDITNDVDGNENDTICVIHCDNNICDTTIIIITSTPGVPPVAVDDEATTTVDSSIVIPVLDNDFDPDQDSIILTGIITDPVNGTVTINDDGTVTYDPAPGYSGVDSFEYVICDSPFDGCDSAWVTITIEDADCLFPQAITPNGDGVNDYFEIYCLDDQPGVTLKVFNRWGNEVYYNENYQNDWDGTFENKVLPDGAYYYVIDYNKILSGDRTTRGGYIMIHR